MSSEKLMTVDLKPFMVNGELERYGEHMADWWIHLSSFESGDMGCVILSELERELVCEALTGSVNEFEFVAATAEMTKQQAQAFVELLAESCLAANVFGLLQEDINCWDHFSERMDEIAALNKYGKSLQMDIDIHDVDTR